MLGKCAIDEERRAIERRVEIQSNPAAAQQPQYVPVELLTVADVLLHHLAADDVEAALALGRNLPATIENRGRDRKRNAVEFGLTDIVGGIADISRLDLFRSVQLPAPGPDFQQTTIGGQGGDDVVVPLVGGVPVVVW